MSPKKRTRWVLYCRVSTVDQAKEGVSLAAQKERLRAWCRANDVAEAALVTDAGVSASIPFANREGGTRVLRMLDEGKADGVAIVKLDRAFRSTVDCVVTIDQVFRPNGWAIVSLGDNLDTTTASGRFVVRTLASLAELERDLISERTTDALAHLKAQGVRMGRAGHGWRYGKKLDRDGRRVIEEIPEEVETIARAKELRAEGASLRAIAETLTAEKRPTKLKKSWHAKTVRTLLGEA